MFRTLHTLLIAGITFMMLSCQSTPSKLGQFNVLPHPQQFDVQGVSDLSPGRLKSYFAKENAALPLLGDGFKNLKKAESESDAQVIFSINAALDVAEQGYLMSIGADKINIEAKDDAGLFYAFQTLGQLVTDASEQQVNLPQCTIKDYPLLTYRSVHLDIKHHMETKDYYYDLIDKLAGYKVNGIIVELEDKIKYERQPVIGSADAWTIDEWKKFSDYANERFIEISPLVQGLGHASFILKHDEYKPLRDDPKSDWAFNPLDPKTYEVQFDLYLDAMKATPHGKYLHIGGDEVHTTGRGSGKSPLELQLMWLDKVSKFAEEHGRIPIFWDDMPLKHAGVYRPMFNSKLTAEEVDKIWAENEHKLLEFLDLFPKNCIYMRWNYSNSDAIGNQKAMEWFRKNGMQVMGATAGQTRWVLMPQEESNMNNIRSFAMASINSGLKSLLLTLWDDDSPHFELYMRGILAFSEYTWSGEKRSKEELKAAYRHREYSYTVAGDEYAFIDQLEQPVAYWKNALLKGNSRNYLVSQKDPINKSVIDMPDPDKKGEWTKQYADRLKQSEKVLATCDSIEVIIEKTKALAVRNSFRLDVYSQVNNLVRFAPKALFALKAYDNAQSDEERKQALDRVQQLKSEFASLRKELEAVYSKTRILNKPDDYILDQDHHVHLANQTKSFDWQFMAEMLFLQKIDQLK
jgi:hypothetical protein